MEKIMYPLKNMWITCVPGQYLHKYCQAIDDQGKDYATIDKIYAPFTGKVVRKYPSECEIWFESIDKVEFADGTIDYATILFAHKDRYDDIKEGVVYKQGEVIYSEGTKAGNKVGGAQRHVHFEICKGITKNPGWKKSPDGTWNLVKGKKPTDCYFIDGSINVIKNGGLNFKKIETPKVEIVNPVERDETTDQLKVLVDSLRVRTGHSTKDSVLGFVQKNAIYNYYETYNDNTYTWYRIGDNQWIADNGEWLEIYAAVDYKQMCETLLEEIKHLKETNSNLANENLTLKDKLRQIHNLSE